MSVCVKSEIGALQKVLLHRPGCELEHLIPGTLERLLFDDIPYLKVAQREHDIFAQVLRDNGAEVVYLEDLMAETLRFAPQLRETFVQEFIGEAGSVAQSYRSELSTLLMEMEDEKDLVLKTMAGVNVAELERTHRNPLVSLVRQSSRFVLDPIPNLYFTRDPFATIGTGVSLNRMYSSTRCRETIYGRYILAHHPDFAGKAPLYYNHQAPFSIEGGDILNLSPKVLAIGLSQRTSPEAIELLARRLFWDETSQVDTILALDIPDMRAYMHLDTVFTQVDQDKFTLHPGILDTLRIYEITRGEKQGHIKARELQSCLRGTLQTYLEVEKVTLIRCGGKDRIAAEREQWNDGSNTLCVAPGVVTVYDRNYITNEILRDNGITVLELPSSELSRGRGGPRCMSMPLLRQEL